jgi:hypothetical protein
MRCLEFVAEVQAINPERGFALTSEILWVIFSAMLLGIFVCLKFMWEIRHPKTDCWAVQNSRLCGESSPIADIDQEQSNVPFGENQTFSQPSVRKISHKTATILQLTANTPRNITPPSSGYVHVRLRNANRLTIWLIN